MKALLFAATLLLLSAPLKAEVTLVSPDGNFTVRVATGAADGVKDALLYSVQWKGRRVIEPSPLGLVLEDGTQLDRGFRMGEAAREKVDRTWTTAYGEQRIIPERYRQVVIDLRAGDEPGFRMTLTVRAYNEGMAFRYTLPGQPGLEEIVIAREASQFRFAGDYPVWAVYSAQGTYRRVPLSTVKKGCERPLVAEAAPDLFIALAEAGLVDYARMKFDPAGSPNTLVSALHGPVRARAPLTTPWRVIMAADAPGRLLENNYLLLNLNEPCALEDTSWIKPGKVIREVTLTTAGGKACVDFAAAHGLQYVEFDAGWYGHEYDDRADATTVTVDPKRSPGPLDLQEVIRYAAERDIGIILYVNRRALEKQLDAILPLYASWGVKGVKYGFVNVGPQPWTAWLHEAIRKAAAHRLMVDVHDEYRPTGYSRTYPNLMTQEGIGGDETSPSNEQTLAIAFTRMLAGAADNTVCYFDGRVAKNACHAYQLAKPVCLFSPWQFLYWYDRPGSSDPAKGGAGGAKPTITEEPELAFYADLPTVWDETRVLHGAIGQYAVIARRNGEAWHLGAMNAGDNRNFEVPLSFLEKGRRYTARRYAHDPSLGTRTNVRITEDPVTAETVLAITLGAKGGEAIRIAPADGPESR